MCTTYRTRVRAADSLNRVQSFPAAALNGALVRAIIHRNIMYLRPITPDRARAGHTSKRLSRSLANFPH